MALDEAVDPTRRPHLRRRQVEARPRRLQDRSPAPREEARTTPVPPHRRADPVARMTTGTRARSLRLTPFLLDVKRSARTGNNENWLTQRVKERRTVVG